MKDRYYRKNRDKENSDVIIKNGENKIEQFKVFFIIIQADSFQFSNFDGDKNEEIVGELCVSVYIATTFEVKRPLGLK